MFLLFQSSFRLSEKNEKDKKRKELTPVSATPTHMLRICVNSHDDPLLSRGEHCSPAKKYKVTFLLFALFTDEKRGKSHLRGFSILLKIFFRRLAATSANKMPRPSRYSLTTATGSKRSSADSDLLLCHVRLWQTSRFEFGCASACEHSEIEAYYYSPVISLTLFTPALHL